MDKVVHKSEKKVSGDISSELASYFRNSLVGASSSKCRRLPETVCAQSSANSFQDTLLGIISSPRISALP